jgi:hypothetical protein
MQAVNCFLNKRIFIQPKNEEKRDQKISKNDLKEKHV